jgi:hypothetical protein
MAEIAIVQRQVDAGGSDCRPASATSKRPARVYLPWRLSDAGPQHRRIGYGGPASETLYNFANSVDAPDLGPDAHRHAVIARVIRPCGGQVLRRAGTPSRCSRQVGCGSIASFGRLPGQVRCAGNSRNKPFGVKGDGMNVIQAPKLEPRIMRHELSTASGASSDRCRQISHTACRVWTMGVSGAPGGEKDEACSKAGLDKVADQLK